MYRIDPWQTHLPVYFTLQLGETYIKHPVITVTTQNSNDKKSINRSTSQSINHFPCIQSIQLPTGNHRGYIWFSPGCLYIPDQISPCFFEIFFFCRPRFQRIEQTSFLFLFSGCVFSIAYSLLYFPRTLPGK